MIPDHCKDVSVRDVDFDLTPDNIATHVKGKKAYTRTDHMVPVSYTHLTLPTN